MSPALMPTYARTPIAFERGEGAYLFTSDGRRYLDFAAGIAVNALGHAHPHLVAALTEQAGKLWHVPNPYEIPESALAEDEIVPSDIDGLPVEVRMVGEVNAQTDTSSQGD